MVLEVYSRLFHCNNTGRTGFRSPGFTHSVPMRTRLSSLRRRLSIRSLRKISMWVLPPGRVSHWTLGGSSKISSPGAL